MDRELPQTQPASAGDPCGGDGGICGVTPDWVDDAGWVRLCAGRAARGDDGEEPPDPDEVFCDDPDSGPPPGWEEISPGELTAQAGADGAGDGALMARLLAAGLDGYADERGAPPRPGLASGPAAGQAPGKDRAFAGVYGEELTGLPGARQRMTCRQQRELICAALRDGVTGLDKAPAIASYCPGLSPAGALEAEKILPGLDTVEEMTRRMIRDRIARAVMQVNPGAARKRREAAGRDRRVGVRPELSGNAQLSGRELPPAAALAASQALTARALELREASLAAGPDELRATAYMEASGVLDPLQNTPPGTSTPGGGSQDGGGPGGGPGDGGNGGRGPGGPGPGGPARQAVPGTGGQAR